MSIDTRTVYVLSSAGLVCLSGLVALVAASYPAPLRRYGLVWAAATFVEGLGLAAVAVRGLVPDLASVVGGHAFAIGGLAGFQHALARFAGRRGPLWRFYWPVALATASCLFFLLVVPSYPLRVSVFSAIAAAQLAACAVVALDGAKAGAPVTARLASGGLAMSSALFAVRAVLSVAIEAEATPMRILAAGPGEQVLVLLISLDLLLISFVFVMLSTESLTSTLRELALVDPLTGLKNRRGLRELALREVDRARRHGSDLSVALVDLDNLKQINDSRGHAAGDAALELAAGVLSAGLRGQDAIGRWGGDEILIVLPDTGVDGALEVSERMRSSVAASCPAEAGVVPLSVSIGVGSGRGPDLDLEALVHDADVALYVAKRAGRNRVSAAPARGP